MSLFLESNSVLDSSALNEAVSPSMLNVPIKNDVNLPGPEEIVNSMVNHNESVIEKYAQLMKEETQHYVQDIIVNMHREHTQKYDNREEELYHEIQQLQQTIVSLQIELENQQQKGIREKEEQFVIVEKMGEAMYRDQMMFKSKYSVKSIFQHWKTHKNIEKTFRKQEKYVNRVTRQHLLSKYYALLCFQYQQNKFQHQYLDMKFKYDQLSSEVITYPIIFLSYLTISLCMYVYRW